MANAPCHFYILRINIPHEPHFDVTFQIYWNDVIDNISLTFGSSGIESWTYSCVRGFKSSYRHEYKDYNIEVEPYLTSQKNFFIIIIHKSRI